MKAQSVKYKSSMEQVEVGVKSLSPFLWVRTHEESRFLDDMVQSAAKMNRDIYVWSLSQGLVSPAIAASGEVADGPMKDTLKPQDAVAKIVNLAPSTDGCRGVCVVMRDPQIILQAATVRKFRDVFQKLKDNSVTIIFLSADLGHGPQPKPGLPPSMEKEITVIDYTLPTLEEIDGFVREIVRETARQNQPTPDQPPKTQEKMKQMQERLRYSQEDYQSFARALQGLTESEINSATSACLHHMKRIDAEFLIQTKKQIVSRSDILEYIDMSKTMDDIGGMDQAKVFFDDYKFAHTQEAKDFGVEPLKGILLLGIPGCGKSQLCKAVAHSWKLPLIRMDVGKVMTGLVGGSESRMRSAVQQIEAIAPCVLWIDEVEKALSGTKSSNFSDGGTMARVFGTLLTAMEEGLEGVTILATANDVSALPPEFLRRFDEIFFVDLPGPDERKEIAKIHLRLRGREDVDLDFDALVKSSDNYTGHEIEKAVKRAITFSFHDESKKLKTEHMIRALEDTKPLFQTMGEKLIQLREKAAGRFRYASTWAMEKGKKYQAKESELKISELDLPDLEKEEPEDRTKTSDKASLQLD